MRSEDGEPARKRFKPNYEDTISVLVGPEKTKFTVHEATICARSPFFAAAMRRNWKEANSKTVELLETTPPIFSAYVHWTYTSLLQIPLLSDSSDRPSHEALARMFVFADMMLDEHLCNYAIDATIRKWRYEEVWANIATINYIWAHTPKKSPIRKLHVDLYTTSAQAEDWYQDDQDDLPNEFVQELARRFLACEGLIALTYEHDQQHICRRYHTHEDGHSCWDVAALVVD